jgi:hypothetical protein
MKHLQHILNTIVSKQVGSGHLLLGGQIMSHSSKLVLK